MRHPSMSCTGEPCTCGLSLLLNDGKIIDHILAVIAKPDPIIVGRCSRPQCRRLARPGFKTCVQCAATAARYMKKYHARRKDKAKGATA